MNRREFAAAHDRYLDPPDDEWHDDEPCEWCNSYRKCRCEEDIAEYEWTLQGGDL